MREFAGHDLAVVIPTRNRWEILKRTLRSLADQTVRGFETIVVLDGKDQSPPNLGEAKVLSQDHAGPGAARNLAARSTERALLLFLGDDMIPAPDLISRHLAKHNEQPQPQFAVLGHVELHSEVRANRLNRWMDWSGNQFDYRNITSEDAGWGRFYSCNTSLKRDFFLEAGGFDEDFFYYYEDLDCGWRLHQKGLRLFYERNALVHHLHALSWNDLMRRFQGIAPGERMMATKHAWFEPYFANRIRSPSKTAHVSRVWPLLVDQIPTNLTKLRRIAERKTNVWYLQQVAPYFSDAWEGSRDLEDLQEYLGERFDRARLTNHMHEVRRELAAVGDEATFYRTSEAYLYDLTVFAMSGTKVPYHIDLKRLVGAGSRLLDWGCGIGCDGLRLIEDGYKVSFADFDNPSTKYLRWRLDHRGVRADVYDIDNDDIPSGFDAAYSFDVIEHVEDPFALLSELERAARIVIVNLLEDEPDHLHPHRPLPIRSILDHASSRGVLAYRRYHGRSHLVAYRGTEKPTVLDRVRTKLQRRVGPSIPALRGMAGPTKVFVRSPRASLKGNE